MIKNDPRFIKNNSNSSLPPAESPLGGPRPGNAAPTGMETAASRTPKSWKTGRNERTEGRELRGGWFYCTPPPHRAAEISSIRHERHGGAPELRSKTGRRCRTRRLPALLGSLRAINSAPPVLGPAGSGVVSAPAEPFILTPIQGIESIRRIKTAQQTESSSPSKNTSVRSSGGCGAARLTAPLRFHCASPPAPRGSNNTPL